MKISASDVTHVNWQAIEEALADHMATNLKRGMAEAKSAFEELKPGQSKTIKINLATISIRRPKE